MQASHREHVLISDLMQVQYYKVNSSSVLKNGPCFMIALFCVFVRLMVIQDSTKLALSQKVRRGCHNRFGPGGDRAVLYHAASPAKRSSFLSRISSSSRLEYVKCKLRCHDVLYTSAYTRRAWQGLVGIVAYNGIDLPRQAFGRSANCDDTVHSLIINFVPMPRLCQSLSSPYIVASAER